jgi:hypothetical protein
MSGFLLASHWHHDAGFEHWDRSVKSNSDQCIRDSPRPM